MNELWRNVILSSPLPHVITIIGGGGKTSLMYYMLEILSDKGAIAATTTKLSCQYVPDQYFVEIQSLEKGQQAIKQSRNRQRHMTLVSGKDPQDTNKMLGIPSVWIDQLAESNNDRIFVVEGDGSAGKSLKGHLSHEPVIPKSSAVVIVVIGIDSVGRPVNDHNVHRPARICALTGAEPDLLITTQLISQLLFHSQGYLHNCPAGSRIVPFINKVESDAQYRQAYDLAERIFVHQHAQIAGVMVGSVFKKEGIWLQP